MSSTSDDNSDDLDLEAFDWILEDEKEIFYLDGAVETTNVIKPSRKRKRHYDQKDSEGNWLIPHIPLPRIPKSDFRRKYAEFLTGVYNSGDALLLQKFVRDVFSNNRCFRFGYDGKYYRLVNEQCFLYQLCYEHMYLTPDVVFDFNAHRIKVRSDGTASLFGNFRVTGNKIVRSTYEEKLARDDHQMSPSFRLLGNRIVYAAGSIDHRPVQASFQQRIPEEILNDSVSEKQEILDNFQPSDFQLFPQPKQMEIDIAGEFVLVLDAEARVTNMDLLMTTYLLNRMPALS